MSLAPLWLGPTSSLAGRQVAKMRRVVAADGLPARRGRLRNEEPEVGAGPLASTGTKPTTGRKTDR